MIGRNVSRTRSLWIPLIQGLLVVVLVSGGCQAPSPQFDGEQAMDYLLAQCDLGPRNPGSEGHRRAIDYLTRTLEGYGAQVRHQVFPFTDDENDSTYQLCNIIASFRPEEERRFLFCAHWDTRPRADRDPDPKRRHLPILGANDGGSGVAILLEMAHLFSLRSPPLGVDLILFDGEDYGREGRLDHYLIGSTNFAAQHRTYRPEVGILLDMVGDRDLDIFIERYSAFLCPELVEIIWDRARDLGIEEFHREQRHAVIDDHLPLNEAGIKCVDLIDFEYPHWHTLQDTPDKCSAESLAKVGRLMVDLVYRPPEVNRARIP
jgi:glutaminyl-peptide cyclotransferase